MTDPIDILIECLDAARAYLPERQFLPVAAMIFDIGGAR